MLLCHTPLPNFLNNLPSNISLVKTFNQNLTQHIFTFHTTGKTLIANNNDTLG